MSREIAAPFRATVFRTATAPAGAASSRRAATDRPPIASGLAVPAVLLFSALLCGCGIKGGLRQPPPPATAPVASPAEPAAAPAPSDPPAIVAPAAKQKP